jgi:ketosteroid isomerase-like protein
MAALCALVATAAPYLHAEAARPGKRHKESRRSESHEIEALEEQWRDAMLKNDATAIDKMTTDDFLSITSNGTLSDKPEYLHRISSHVNDFSTFDLKVLKVRVQPSSAIATSETHVIGTLDGRPVDGVFRYTKVYTRATGGAWRVANFEVTRVSRGAAGEPGMERGTPLNAAPVPSQAAPH